MLCEGPPGGRVENCYKYSHPLFTGDPAARMHTGTCTSLYDRVQDARRTDQLCGRFLSTTSWAQLEIVAVALYHKIPAPSDARTS